MRIAGKERWFLLCILVNRTDQEPPRRMRESPREVREEVDRTNYALVPPLIRLFSASCTTMSVTTDTVEDASFNTAGWMQTQQ